MPLSTQAPIAYLFAESQGAPAPVDRRIATVPPEAVASSLETPLLGGVLPTEVGRHVLVSHDQCSQSTGSSGTLFIYGTAGKGWSVLGDQRLVIKPGELLVIPSETPYAYGADEDNPWGIYWVNVRGSLIGEYLKALRINSERPVLNLGHDARLIGLFVELLDVLEESHAESNLLCASSILQHMIGIFLRVQRAKRSVLPDATQRVAASIEFMKCNLARPLDISMLSDLAKVSPSHYSTLFKRQTGYSPVDYLIRLRVHAAAELLISTNLDVKAIAAKLGYRDPLYFSRVFVGVKGLSPSKYRRQVRESAEVPPQSASPSGFHPRPMHDATDSSVSPGPFSIDTSPAITPAQDTLKLAEIE
jgi:AraC-like DNA-binding protein